MSKVDFIRRIRLACTLLAGLFFPLAVSAKTQPATIILHDERLSITPKEFYISNITDGRENRDAIAILVSANTANQGETYPADLENGALSAIKSFVGRNLPRNIALPPVSIGLKKFMVTEKALPGGLAEGHAVVVLSFSLENNETPQHLIDYTGTATYTRSIGPAQDVEPTLRHLLENGLVYFNTWMNRQAGTDIRLAKAVKITFNDYHEKKEGDSIYYDVGRPLTWADFRSAVPSSKFDAEVFPTIGYSEHTEVVNGVANVVISVKACLPKSAAWVKAGSMTDYILNHEQRHFDIAKIASEHFKKDIASKQPAIDNYEAIINEAYLDAYRDMSNMQRQYDEETSHGSNRAEQYRWNKKIDDELKALGIK